MCLTQTCFRLKVNKTFSTRRVCNESERLTLRFNTVKASVFFLKNLFELLQTYYRCNRG